MKETPREDFVESCNSYLGLYRHTGTRAQIAAIGRVAAQRGFRVESNLTKIKTGRRGHG
ncbi:MAG: hypothetical protein M0006_08190 [Magnetospirillum sp.]|nr:hypothetical protein [Magnetospirillum sp.]